MLQPGVLLECPCIMSSSTFKEEAAQTSTTSTSASSKQSSLIIIIFVHSYCHLYTHRTHMHSIFDKKKWNKTKNVNKPAYVTRKNLWVLETDSIGIYIYN